MEIESYTENVTFDKRCLHMEMAVKIKIYKDSLPYKKQVAFMTNIRSIGPLDTRFLKQNKRDCVELLQQHAELSKLIN